MNAIRKGIRLLEPLTTTGASTWSKTIGSTRQLGHFGHPEFTEMSEGLNNARTKAKIQSWRRRPSAMGQQGLPVLAHLSAQDALGSVGRRMTNRGEMNPGLAKRRAVNARLMSGEDHDDDRDFSNAISALSPLTLGDLQKGPTLNERFIDLIVEDVMKALPEKGKKKAARKKGILSLDDRVQSIINALCVKITDLILKDQMGGRYNRRALPNMFREPNTQATLRFHAIGAVAAAMPYSRDEEIDLKKSIRNETEFGKLAQDILAEIKQSSADLRVLIQLSGARCRYIEPGAVTNYSSFSLIRDKNKISSRVRQKLASRLLVSPAMHVENPEEGFDLMVRTMDSKGMQVAKLDRSSSARLFLGNKNSYDRTISLEHGISYMVMGDTIEVGPKLRDRLAEVAHFTPDVAADVWRFIVERSVQVRDQINDLPVQQREHNFENYQRLSRDVYTISVRASLSDSRGDIARRDQLAAAIWYESVYISELYLQDNMTEERLAEEVNKYLKEVGRLTEAELLLYVNLIDDIASRILRVNELFRSRLIGAIVSITSS